MSVFWVGWVGVVPENWRNVKDYLFFFIGLGGWVLISGFKAQGSNKKVQVFYISYKFYAIIIEVIQKA